MRPDADYSQYNTLFEPIEESSRGFYYTVAFLVFLVLVGATCYLMQLIYGLGVTGMNQPVSWGFYITNFVFFIGISHAGTLISAILRLSRAEWRRPVTRMAEVITVMVLAVGASQVLVDLGRVDRMFNIFFYGRYQSPLLWDVTSITTYLTASTIYLYFPMIPDIAVLRDRGKKFTWLYRVLALGWQGTERQVRILNRAISIMAIIVLPVAVSVHTVVSYVFSMTLQPQWHSTIFGPYFVMGAIYSGIAALIISMVILRKIFRLEKFLKQIHFNYLGILLLVMTLFWFYFTFCEYLTSFYGKEPADMAIFWDKFNGRFSPLFWLMITCCFIVPLLILSFRKTRNIKGVTVASITVIVGMYLERFIIIVPTLSHPRLPYGIGYYIPSLVEWGELIGSFALFGLFYVLFTKFFPIISIWEIEEGRREGISEVNERLRDYLPSFDEPAGEQVL